MSYKLPRNIWLPQTHERSYNNVTVHAFIRCTLDYSNGKVDNDKLKETNRTFSRDEKEICC